MAEGASGAVFRFTAEVWEHHGDAAWFFLTLPVDASAEIEELTAHERRGFGSVRVRASIGSTTWSTSVFPDSAAGAYVLPLKKAVRAAEGLDDGDRVDVVVELAEGPGSATA